MLCIRLLKEGIIISIREQSAPLEATSINGQWALEKEANEMTNVANLLVISDGVMIFLANNFAVNGSQSRRGGEC